MPVPHPIPFWSKGKKSKKLEGITERFHTMLHELGYDWVSSDGALPNVQHQYFYDFHFWRVLLVFHLQEKGPTSKWHSSYMVIMKKVILGVIHLIKSQWTPKTASVHKMENMVKLQSQSKTTPYLFSHLFAIHLPVTETVCLAPRNSLKNALLM